MAIDFPNSPTVDEIYSVGDKSWLWNGTYWEVQGAPTSTFSASDTAPASPSAGDIWYRSDTSQTLIYYDSTWVEIGHSANIANFLADADADTKIQLEESSDEDTIRFDTAGVERMTIGASGDIVINNDLTVGTHTLHVDSTTNRVGIGTTSLSYWLEVRDNDLGQTLGDSSDHLRLTSPVVGNTSMLSASNKRFASGTGWQTTSWRIQHRVDTTDMAFVEFNPDGAERGISFGTDNVEHVVIDINGRMAATNQPYFYATLSSNISFDSNTQTTTVPYNTTSANVGNCYNTSNGLFTAPVSGRYIFTGGVYSNTASVSISQLWFVKNGGRVGSFCIDGGGGANRQGTGYIYLDANDTLGVHPWADGIGTITIVSSIFHTYWSGSLLV